MYVEQGLLSLSHDSENKVQKGEADDPITQRVFPESHQSLD